MSLLNPARMAKFGGLTVLSFALNLGLTTLLKEVAGWRAGNAYSVALGVVLVVNFLVMRYKVFHSSATHPAKQLAGFAAGSLVFRALERLAFEGLHGRLGVQYQLAIVLISGVFAVLKYVFYGLTFFRPGREG
ncbi:MAG: GtrA family protein [Kiritimatiellia bacterium]